MSFMRVEMETIERNGMLHPRTVIWPDGRRFPVKKVLHCSTSEEDGLPGVRYTTIIGKEQRNLYCVDREWFVMMQEEMQNEKCC